MLFMIIEHFEDGDPARVYRRFAERGRMAPPGLEYHGSWVTDDLRRCFQVMECQDRGLLDQWMANWSDLTDFEVIPVVTSAVSSLPEVVGNAAMIVNPENVFDIARGIREVLIDEGLRNELIRSGFAQVRQFSWRRTAEQTLEVYREVARVR